MQTTTHESSGDLHAETSLADDLRIVIEVFATRWRQIALVVLAFVLIGIAYVWASAPIYTATSEIFIDPRERSTVNQGAIPTGMGSSSLGADISLLESQISIIGSRGVLNELIKREGLDTDPEFISTGSGPVAALRQTARALLYGPNASNFADASPAERALKKLGESIEITRVEQTYVLRIAVSTQSAQKSARIANALAELYLSETQNAVDTSAQETVSSIEARLAELRNASETSQQAVEDYRQNHGLISAQGSLVDERRLTELSAQAVSASVATEAARVTLESLKAGGVASATSDTLRDLRVSLDQALSTENALASTLGARHPRLAEARESRLSLERALEAEFERVIARAQSSYETAQENEASLKALLDQSTSALSLSNTASVKLRELEQIANQDRGLYDAFATKAKQLREQIALPTTTARIIAFAEPPVSPSEPRIFIVLGIAGFLGMVAGFGWAWLMYLIGRPGPVRPKLTFEVPRIFKPGPDAAAEPTPPAPAPRHKQVRLRTATNGVANRNAVRDEILSRQRERLSLLPEDGDRMAAE